MKKNKTKIALVNQRYGLEVNGGSEYYTRELAEHLKQFFDVEILTTKALNYSTWENFYSHDEEEINGIKVKRFHVDKKRNTFAMKIWNRMCKCCPIGKEIWENKWIDAQGPYSTGLIDYISKHREEYVFIFITYLYYHSVRGIQKVGENSILIPTAHDEPYIYYDIYKNVFEMPKGIIYLTQEEKEFVESQFNVGEKPNCICGAGVEIPKDIDEIRFRKKYNIETPYFIYVGRIDESKGCKEMISLFLQYKETDRKSRVKLILLGKANMEIQKNEDIVSLGFVSEQEKFDAISGAIALWLPSKYESLSIAVLEAMATGVPVLVNGICEVLKGHCQRSEAGFYYLSEKEAIKEIQLLQKMDNRDEVKTRALKYITDNYEWEAIISKLTTFIKATMINDEGKNE